MPTETSVIIPKHDNDYARTDVAQSIFETFVFYVSTHFGGCSVVEGKGFYKMNDTSVNVMSGGRLVLSMTSRKKLMLVYRH